MAKVVYLLVGVMLKQTVDEIKALISEYVESLKKYSDAVAEYRPLPAMEAGSLEAARTIAYSRHIQSVEPELRRISRKILLLRLVPLAFYVIITAGLLVWAIWLEAE
jgi:hypothetical protein